MRARKKTFTFLTLLYVLGSLFAFAAMIYWPQETYLGAYYGVELWATILVPSLLPFFIIAEVILNLGIVKALGVLLEPFMRPVFNLPGSASFVIIMGFTAGFPMGALLTRRLVEEKLCSLKEAERLVAFTNNSSILFILAAISAGIFNNPLLGIILATAHYLSNILLGVLLGLFSPRQGCVYSGSGDLFVRSIKTLLAAQRERPSWGYLLGSAVRKGVNSITLIGGFIVFFAVIIRLLKASGVLALSSSVIDLMTSCFGLTLSLGPAFATGFWEMSLGIKELSYFSSDITQIAVAASILLAWSGICIQTQVVSVLAGSGIRPRLYYLCRILQCIFSASIAYLLTATMNFWSAHVSVPVYSALFTDTTPFFEKLAYSLAFFCKSFIAVIVMFMISWFSFYFFFYLKKIVKHVL